MRVSRRAAFTAIASSLLAACREGRLTDGPCPGVSGRRIRWVVPNAAGGGYDTEARLLQPLVERELHAEIVIDNRPGAGGLVGARAIAGSKPDGLTLGLLGVPGLLVSSLTGAVAAPDPARDFTILGRIARSWHVWATGARTAWTSMDTLVAASASRPLVCALNEAGSASLVSMTATASMLGVPIEYVSGFSGTRSACLAAMRGDVDLVCYNFETIRDLLRGGDLRALLQVSATPIADDPSLARAAVLGGSDGYAARRAAATGQDSLRARSAADAIVSVIGGGRIVVAPAGLPDDIRTCLGRVMARVLTGAELRASSRRALDPSDAAAARADVEHAARLAPGLVPAVRVSLARLRGR